MHLPLLKSEINKKLKAGLSKNDIYTDLADTVDDNNLRRMLSSRPTETSLHKFKVIHRIVIGLWMLFILLDFLGSLEDIVNLNFKGILALFLSILVFIQVWKLNGDVILPGMIWLGMGIGKSIIELKKIPASDPDYESIILFCYIYIASIILCIILMYYLRKKIFNYYSWFKPKKDINGNFVFQEEDARIEMT